MKKYEIAPYSGHPGKPLKKSLKGYRKIIKSNSLPIDALLANQNHIRDVCQDIPDELKISIHNGGVNFGLDPFWDLSEKNYFIGKSQDEDGHILVVGSPGCHKTTGVILPTILTWKGTFVAVDIKGDITDFCWRYRDEIAYPTAIIDFVDSKKTVRFDPFQKLRTDKESELISNARELSLAIIPTPHDVREPFWIQGAQNILTAIILYSIGKGIDFNSMIEMALTTPAETILKAIRGSENEKAKSFVIPYHPEAGDKTLQGSFIEVVNHLHDFSHIQIQRIFESSGGIDLSQSVSNCNLIIRIPESKLDQWSSAVRLILRQLFSTLSNRPEKFSYTGRYHPPFLLLWDEMSRFGKFEDLANAFATLRSKNVTVCATIQSFAQLDNLYGSSVRRTLVDCCSYLVIGAVRDAETQKFCSELVGTTTKWEPHVGDNYNLGQRELTLSRGLNLCREPMIYPEEFATLGDFVVVTPFGKFRVDRAPLLEKTSLSLYQYCSDKMPLRKRL